MREKDRNGRSGLTFIEIIAVVVILGILAAVGVPMYLGYVRDNQQRVVNQAAQTAAAAADGYYRKMADPTITISPEALDLPPSIADNFLITVDNSAGTVTVAMKDHPEIKANARFK